MTHSDLDENMTRGELHAIQALAAIMWLRMLGLFMILPVFALYAEQLDHVTPLLIGLAIGIYGLTQALLQIPLGMLSDRWGRKPVITLGLCIFATGSLIAAASHSIVFIIIGRALQGCGAIAAAVLAFAADLTREEHRTKAMAVMGVSIGMAFIVALVVGPILNYWLGVPGIFALTAGLALFAIVILYVAVPNSPQCRFHRDAEPVPAQFKRVLHNTQLLRLNAGVFILHCLLTVLFIELPLVLKDVLTVDYHWTLYLPVLLISVMLMIPLIIVAEKYRHVKSIFIMAVTLLALSQLGLMLWHQQLWHIAVWLVVFFTAFNVLEASLPSLISKIAPAESKGTALGVHATAQFLGAFCGGVGGGWLHQQYDIPTVFLACLGLTLIWWLLAMTMQNPRPLSSQLLNVGMINEKQATELKSRLLAIPGVAEAAIILEDGVAYLKVDKQQLDKVALHDFMETLPVAEQKA